MEKIYTVNLLDSVKVFHALTFSNAKEENNHD